MTLSAFVALGLALQAVAGEAAAIEVQADIRPDSVRVGERITLTVTVRGVADEAGIVFATLPDTGVVTALGPPSPGGEPGARSARYQLAAWEIGEFALPLADVRVVSGATELRIPLPDVRVRVVSVLPAEADIDTLAWKPPADVLGPNWSLGEKLAAAGLALAVLLATVLYLRRRGTGQPVPPPPPARSAQARALEALDRLEASGLVDAGELKGFYSAVSHILREFLAVTDAAWGLDLTTAELMERIGRDGVPDSQVLTLSGLLDGADFVKFARRRPTRAQAARALDAARRWLVEFERAAPVPEPALDAAERPAAETVADFELEDVAAMDEVFADQTTEGDEPGQPESRGS